MEVWEKFINLSEKIVNEIKFYIMNLSLLWADTFFNFFNNWSEQNFSVILEISKDIFSNTNNIENILKNNSLVITSLFTQNLNIFKDSFDHKLFEKLWQLDLKLKNVLDGISKILAEITSKNHLSMKKFEELSDILTTSFSICKDDNSNWFNLVCSKFANNNKGIIKNIQLIGKNLIEAFTENFESAFVEKTDLKFKQNTSEFNLIVNDIVMNSTSSINSCVLSSTNEILLAIKNLGLLLDDLNNYIETIINWSIMNIENTSNSFIIQFNKLTTFIEQSLLNFSTPFKHIEESLFKYSLQSKENTVLMSNRFINLRSFIELKFTEVMNILTTGMNPLIRY
jgi:hypothetical protein